MWLIKVVNKSGEYVVNKKLKKGQYMVLISLRNDPNITIAGLSRETSLGNTAIHNNLSILQSLDIINAI